MSKRLALRRMKARSGRAKLISQARERYRVATEKVRQSLYEFELFKEMSSPTTVLKDAANSQLASRLEWISGEKNYDFDSHYRKLAEKIGLIN
jgi:hypothetical protein